MRYRKLLNPWLGLTLSTLLFYPLFASLSDNVILLQWQKKNTLELILVLILSAVIFTSLLWINSKLMSVVLRTAILLLLVFLPLFSFFYFFIEQLGLKALSLTAYKLVNYNLGFWCSFGGLLLFLVIILIAKYPLKVNKYIVTLLLLLSPINLLAGLVLWKVKNTNSINAVNKNHFFNTTPTIPSSSFVVLLFDELSYDYLYKNCVVNPKYPNFKRLSLFSSNYHNAISPGVETTSAVPSIIMSHRYNKIIMKNSSFYEVATNNKEYSLNFASDNIFALAQAKGYKTFAYGPYLPYCSMFNNSLDGCRSFSLYNYATADTSFSILHPIMTVLCLWPKQKPFGYLKNIAMSEWQKKQTEENLKLILSTLKNKGDLFLYSHIFVTHVPHVFNKYGYYYNNNAYTEDNVSYTNAVEYADNILGQVIDKMIKENIYDSSEIVVLADHNFRVMYPGKENHIPLIIKRPYQTIGTDNNNLIHAEERLKSELINKPF